MKANVLFQWLMIALTFVIAFVLGNYALASGIQRLPSGVGGFGFALLGNGNSNRVNIGIAFLISLDLGSDFRLNFGHPYLNFIHFCLSDCR